MNPLVTKSRVLQNSSISTKMKLIKIKNFRTLLIYKIKTCILVNFGGFFDPYILVLRGYTKLSAQVAHGVIWRTTWGKVNMRFIELPFQPLF